MSSQTFNSHPFLDRKVSDINRLDSFFIQMPTSDVVQGQSKMVVPRGVSSRDHFKSVFYQSTGVPWTDFTESIETNIGYIESIKNVPFDDEKIQALEQRAQKTLASVDSQDDLIVLQGLLTEYTSLRSQLYTNRTSMLEKSLSVNEAMKEVVGHINDALSDDVVDDETELILNTDSLRTLGESFSDDNINTQALKKSQEGLLKLNDEFTEKKKQIDVLLKKYALDETSEGEEFNLQHDQTEDDLDDAYEAASASATIVYLLLTEVSIAAAAVPWLWGLAAALAIYALFEFINNGGFDGDENGSEGGSRAESAGSDQGKPGQTPIKKGPVTGVDDGVLAAVDFGEWEQDWNANLGGEADGIPFVSGWKGSELVIVFQLPTGPLPIYIDMQKEGRGLLHKQLLEVSKSQRDANIIDFQEFPAGSDVTVSFMIEGVYQPAPLAGDVELSRKFALIEVLADGQVKTLGF